jgi:HAE1 family hydrophobic/amphiphilic exporter-1
MVTLAVILIGFISLSRLPIDLLPNLEFPIVVISTSYPGVGPQEIESLVTMPLEQGVGTISGIENISSRSSEGNSLIIAEFTFGTDMGEAALELRERIDMIRPFFPDDVSAPVVQKIDPDALPIVQISLKGTDDLVSLQLFAEEILSPQLERIDGVAAVSVNGGYTRQVEIIVDPMILHSYQIPIDTLMGMIGAENLNLPGGVVNRGDQEFTIRTIGEFTSISEIRDLRFMLRTGESIRLGDISQVNFVEVESSSIVRSNGERSLDISVSKQSGTNTVRVARNVMDALDEITNRYSQYEIEPILNQAEFIELSIDNLLESGILGSILAILVLLFFFRNIKTTMIIAIAIPVSVIATFVLLYFANITLNLMTLGGLALAIGMLVDNSIVVLENIYRFRESGENKVNAAIKGASEVAMAVTASTLTTVAVFIPIVFVEGITSEIFRELALTITLSLLASLAVSLTVIPMLSSKLLDTFHTEKELEETTLGKMLGSLREKYNNLLKAAINNPGKTVLAGVLVFAISMSSILLVGTEFFPEVDQGQFSVNVRMPSGTSVERTLEVTQEVEDLILTLNGIKTVYSNVSKGSSSINVMTDMDRDYRSADLADNVRDMVRDIPGVNISVSVMSAASLAGGGMGGAPISISIRGDDLDELERISSELVNIVSQVEGTRMVASSFTSGVPEIQVRVDRLQASQYGLTTAQVANTVRTIMTGSTVTRYKYEGSEINVVIKGEDIYNQGIASLSNLMINTPTEAIIPLSQIASIELAQGPRRIDREAQQRVVTVSSQIYQRDLGSVSADVEKVLDEYHFPPGYSYGIGGEFTELQDALNDLTLALALSIVLVYMVLASQFESFLHPFIIMFAVPLSFSGGALGLFLTGNRLSVPAMIGAIILAGIVVNDAIVLVDYINTRRRDFGEDIKTAIISAGPIRLRPILITTLTTSLALIPLSLGLGEGGELLAPMGIAVIFGITVATLLTLVFIPAMYLLLDKLASKIRKEA